MKLDQKQRDHISDKMMDTANLVFAGLFIAKFFEEEWQWYYAASGVIVYILMFILSVRLKGKMRK